MRSISYKKLSNEAKIRNAEAISRGFYEAPVQRKQRLINALMKTWITPNGEIFTMRSYLVKYDRKEYKRILAGIMHPSNTGTIEDLKGLNLHFSDMSNFRNDGHVNYDGRVENFLSFMKKTY